MALRRSISASSSGTRIAKIVEIGFGRDNSDGRASFLLTYKNINSPFHGSPDAHPDSRPSQAPDRGKLWATTLTLWQSSDNSRIEDLRRASIIN